MSAVRNAALVQRFRGSNHIMPPLSLYRSNRLHTGLLVVGHDRDRRSSRLLARGPTASTLDLAIETQDLRHLGVDFGIATLEIIAHLVRLDLVRRDDLAQRALSERGEAFMPRRRAVLANVPPLSRSEGIGGIGRPSLEIGRRRRCLPCAGLRPSSRSSHTAVFRACEVHLRDFAMTGQRRLRPFAL